MSELEMTNEAETEDFTDELSDEALDRQQEGGKLQVAMSGAPWGYSWVNR